MKIKVTLHNFKTNPLNRKARDGANFAYSEYVRLLQSAGANGLSVQIHDFKKLFTDDSYAHDILSSCDCVVSNVGPHAFIYFYLREKFHLHFRIIRDVRTALWNGYLLQEALISPYLRPEDSVIHSSNYSRNLFQKLFPEVPTRSMFVCYPLMRNFPPRPRSVDWGKSLQRSPRIIGYVGRLTDDKNFSQAVELIIELQKQVPNHFRLRAIGEDLVRQYQEKAVIRKIQNMTGAKDLYEWVSPVPYSSIWDEYSKIDVLFFPSTSNLETFGRVLVEATYWGVPVLAGSHAAAPELVTPEALIPTHYYTDREFDAHLAHPLGQVDIHVAAEFLLNNSPLPLSTYYLNYRAHDKLFLSIVLEGNAINDGQILSTPSHSQTRFIKAISMSGLQLPKDINSANQFCDAFKSLLITLHDFGSARYYSALIHLFLASSHRMKTLNFIQRSLRLREDFTNVGGIDLQLSHIVRFYPHFSIKGRDL